MSLKLRIVASAIFFLVLVLISVLAGYPYSSAPLKDDYGVDQRLGIPASSDQYAVSDSQLARLTLNALEPANGYLARIFLNSPDDVERALLRAEELYRRGDVSADDEPLAFVLHGPEVQIFFKDNYSKYSTIVDLAAKLSAFKVVDIKVCKTRLGVLGQSDEVLPPFIKTVPFGPLEVERLLMEEQYVYF